MLNWLRSPTLLKLFVGQHILNGLSVAVGVMAVTAFASTLGARTSGVVASFPLIGAAFGVLAHRADGARAAVAALRGMVAALFSFAFFFFALGLALPRAGVLSAFAAATLVGLIVQAATLTLVRSAKPAPAD